MSRGEMLSQSAGLKGLPYDKTLEVERLLDAIGDHADQGTQHVIAVQALDLPVASLVNIRESVDTHRARIRDRARYVVAALRSELGRG